MSGSVRFVQEDSASSVRKVSFWSACVRRISVSWPGQGLSYCDPFGDRTVSTNRLMNYDEHCSDNVVVLPDQTSAICRFVIQ